MHRRVLVLVLRPRDQIIPLAVEIAVGDAEEDIRLVLIMVVQRPLGHTRRRRDLCQRDVGKRLCIEQAGRGVEDLFFDIVIARSGHFVSLFSAFV